MEWLLATLQLAIGAGLATTFDDNIYLTGFFGEVNRSFRPQHVVVGELLGFTTLVLISLIGILIGLVVPKPIIGLLGILPILIGLRSLLEHWGPAGSTDQRISAQRYADYLGFESRRLSLLDILSDRQTYRVALVTLANGSNNLSIYIPLFASLTPPRALVIILVLYGFVVVWLLLSFHLTRAPGLALLLNRYAPIFFPFILIWLGVRILLESGSLAIWRAA